MLNTKKTVIQIDRGMLAEHIHRDCLTLQESMLRLNLLELKTINLALLTHQKIFLLKNISFSLSSGHCHCPFISNGNGCDLHLGDNSDGLAQ